MNKVSRVLTTALAMTFIGAVGCTGELTAQAKGLLLAANEAYAAGDDRGVINYADTFLRDNEGASEAGEAFYLRGLARYRLKDTQAAEADFAEVVDRTEDKLLKGEALKALGDLAYDGGKMVVAENMYSQAQRFLRADAPPADQVFYRLGQVYQRRGRWAEADAQFNRLIYLFEGNRFAELAGRLVHCSAWTVQVGAFANRDGAATAVKRLRTKGLFAKSKASVVSGRVRFIVQVGRYSMFEEAVAALADVKKHQKDAFVIATR